MSTLSTTSQTTGVEFDAGALQTSLGEALVIVHSLLLHAEVLEAVVHEDPGDRRTALVVAMQKAKPRGLTPASLAPMALRRVAENSLKFRASG